MAMRGRGVNIRGRDDVDLSTRFDRRPTGPGTRVFSLRDDRLHEVPRMESEVLFLSGEMARGKAVLVGTAPLAMASPFGRPDLHVGGYPSE